MTVEVIKEVTQIVEILSNNSKIVEVHSNNSDVLEIVQQGAQGVKGDKGDAGEGIAAGGTTGQALFKNSDTNFDTEWKDIPNPDLSEYVRFDNPNYLRTLTSGIITGCVISINADPAKFNISAGEYLIVDCWTDPSAPITYPVTYAGSTANVVSNLATADFSNIGLDKNGSIIQLITPFDAADRRAYVELAQLGHTSRTSIASVVPSVEVAISPLQQLRDIMSALGVLNNGNGLSANGANLSINRAAGRFTGEGISGNADSPYANIVSFNAISAPTIRHRTQTGNGAANSAFLDVGNYDVAGTVTALSGTKYTNQRVFMFSNGNIVVQYGQTQYNSMGSAVAAINSEPFVPFANVVEKAVLLGVISVRSSATNLSDTAQATFSAPPSGGSVGSVVPTLQGVYENSTPNPEILTNAINGAVAIRRGSATDTDIILEGQNNAGSTTFSVTGEGVVTAKRGFIGLMSSDSTFAVEGYSKIVATGTSSPAFAGTYTRAGTYNGYNYWTDGTNFIWYNRGYWFFSTILGTETAGFYQTFVDSGSNSTPSTAAWSGHNGATGAVGTTITPFINFTGAGSIGFNSGSIQFASRVGFGKFPNNYPLEVLGTMSVSGAATASTSEQLILYTNTSPRSFITAGAGNFGLTLSADYAAGNITFNIAGAERVRFEANGNIAIGTPSPNANAILDVSSTTKAFMPPRMTTTQKNAIVSPTAGMVVYDTTLNKLCVYTTAWEVITSA